MVTNMYCTLSPMHMADGIPRMQTMCAAILRSVWHFFMAMHLGKNCSIMQYLMEHDAVFSVGFIWNLTVKTSWCLCVKSEAYRCTVVGSVIWQWLCRVFIHSYSWALVICCYRKYMHSLLQHIIWQHTQEHFLQPIDTQSTLSMSNRTKLVHAYYVFVISILTHLKPSYGTCKEQMTWKQS